jgi:hypothetical protein
MSPHEKKLAVFTLDGLGEYPIWVPESLAEEAHKLIEGDEDV